MELARGYLRVSPTSFALVLRHAVSGTWHRMKWCWQLLMDRWPPKNHLILLRSRSFLYLDDVCVHGNAWQSTCNQQSDVALTQHNCSLCTKPVREIFHSLCKAYLLWMGLRYLCGCCGCQGDRLLNFWVVFLDFVNLATVVDEVVFILPEKFWSSYPSGI